VLDGTQDLRFHESFSATAEVCLCHGGEGLVWVGTGTDCGVDLVVEVFEVGLGGVAEELTY
jgi:hypothetical protein